MPQQTAGNQRAKKSQRGPAVTPLLDAGSESNAHAEKKPTAPGEKNVSDVIKAANKGIPFEEESESHHDKK
jgi:hypothetical protein